MDGGFGFWLKWAALVVAAGVAALVIFLLIDIAFLAWGVFGTLLAFGAVLLLIGWIADKRREREYAELEE
jgi:Flp pilus assembly protein TadB